MSTNSGWPPPPPNPISGTNPWIFAPPPPTNVPPIPALTPFEQQRRNRIRAAAQALWDQKEARQIAETEIVDTPEKLSRLVDMLWLSGGTSPTIVMDCEGFNEYRLECDVIEIYHIPTDRLYLIDIYELGADIFDLQSTEHKYTLVAYLESNVHLKLMYDCRQDSNALQMSYDIKLDGVVDLSLMVTEVKRHRDPAFHHRVSVDDAIEIRLRDTNNISEFEYQSMKEAKSMRRAMGVLEAWAQRPLDIRLVKYSQDVRLMGTLFMQSLVQHYTGSPANIHCWQVILDVSHLDADYASTSQFQRDSTKSIETPWSPGYWTDPVAKHAHWLVQREAFFQAKISARRIQGHMSRIPDPPVPSAADLRRAHSFTVMSSSMALSPSFLRELRGDNKDAADGEATESEAANVEAAEGVVAGAEVVVEEEDGRPVKRVESAPADVEAVLRRYLFPSSSRWS